MILYCTARRRVFQSWKNLRSKSQRWLLFTTFTTGAKTLRMLYQKIWYVCFCLNCEELVHEYRFSLQSNNTINRFIPDGVMGIAETVGQISVTEMRQEESVKIVDIFNPTFFWVHLQKHVKKLDTMMKELGYCVILL